MGTLGPYARPNMRRTELSSFLSLARGARGFDVSSLLFFGTPSLVVGATVVTGGAGAGLATPEPTRVAVITGGAAVAHARPATVVAATALGAGQGGALVGSVDAPLALVGGGGASALVGGLVLKATLLGRLTPRISTLRAKLTKAIGDRPYRLYLTTAGWSGGRPGGGVAARTRVELGCGVDTKTGMMMPPLIEPKNSVMFDPGVRGLAQAVSSGAKLKVSQISPALVARDIVNFAGLTDSQESYFELEFVGTPGGNGGERAVQRCRLAAAPFYDAYGMGWLLELAPVEPSQSFGGPRP